MSATDRGAGAPGFMTASQPPPGPSEIAAWLTELGIVPEVRVDRDGIVSWDLLLDGRRRFDIRVTLILDPSAVCVVWVHYAPPLTDGFRRSYRMLLRWNDEFPFAKFALSDDGRPILMAELPIDRLDRDEVGLAIARLLVICDQLVDESARWIWLDGKVPAARDLVSRQVGLFARYADRLAELTGE